MLLWGGFVVCLIAQIIVLSLVNAQFKSKNIGKMLGIVKPTIVVWLVFIPAMVFGLLVDLEILIQVRTFQPKTFKDYPPYCRTILGVIGLISLATSVCLILFSFEAFTPHTNARKFLTWFLVCLFIKAFCWAPFIAFELFDTIFENIYLDVQF